MLSQRSSTINMMKAYYLTTILVVFFNREFGVMSATIADQVYSSYDANQSLHDNFHGILWSVCPQSVYCAGENRVPNSTISSGIVTAAREDLKGIRDELLGCCQPCSCEADCQLTNNCCIDAQPAEMLNVAEGSQRCLQADLDQYRPTGIIQKDTVFFFMVTKCLNTTTEINMAQKCESPDIEYFDEVVPVQSDATRLIYRNRFCAQCNGVMNFTDWRAYSYFATILFDFYGQQVMFDLDEMYSVVIAARSKAANIMFYPPLENIELARRRRCFIRPQIRSSTCERTSDTTSVARFFDSACSYKTALFLQTSLVYNNIFCSFCLDVNSILTKEIYGNLCGFSVNKGPQNMIGIMIGRPKVGDGMNDVDTHVEPSTNCTCQEWYDALTNTCRSMKCAMGHSFIACKCVKLMEEIFGLPLLTLLRLRSTDSSTPLTPENTDITLKFIQAAQRTLMKTVEEKTGSKPITLFRHIQNGVSFYDLIMDFEVKQGADTRDVVKYLFDKLQDGLMVRVKGMRFQMKLAPVYLIPIYEKVQFNQRPVSFDQRLFKRYAENTTLMYLDPEITILKHNAIFGKHIFCKSILINDEDLDKINKYTSSNPSDIDFGSSLSFQKDATYMCFDDFISILRPGKSTASSNQQGRRRLATLLWLASLALLYSRSF